MTSWIEPPPKEKSTGCLGKGCFIIIAFLLLLAIAFVIGVYVGTKPKEIPQVQTSPDEQNAVKSRWNEFEAAAQNEQITSPPRPAQSPVPDMTPVEAITPAPETTPASANRIELSANDINQLIAANRKAQGKAFVSIEDNVAHVQLSIPLKKVGFGGRFLNGEFAVRAAPDRNPRNLQITQVSLAGIPDGMVNALLGSHSVQGYLDEFVTKYGITSLMIENNKVILESTGH